MKNREELLGAVDTAKAAYEKTFFDARFSVTDEVTAALAALSEAQRELAVFEENDREFINASEMTVTYTDGSSGTIDLNNKTVERHLDIFILFDLNDQSCLQFCIGRGYVAAVTFA